MNDVEFETLLAQGARHRASDVHITAGVRTAIARRR